MCGLVYGIRGLGRGGERGDMKVDEYRGTSRDSLEILPRGAGQASEHRVRDASSGTDTLEDREMPCFYRVEIPRCERVFTGDSIFRVWLEVVRVGGGFVILYCILVSRGRRLRRR